MSKKPEFKLHNAGSGAALTIHVTPRSRKNEIFEILENGTVKIRLSDAGDVKSANQTLVNYLAEVLGINGTDIEVIAGQAGNDKLVAILGMEAEIVQKKIINALSTQ